MQGVALLLTQGDLVFMITMLHGSSLKDATLSVFFKDITFCPFVAEEV
jgi:hypothetical protein